MGLFPISPTGIWFIDMPLFIFFIWFFVKIFKGDKKKSDESKFYDIDKKKQQEEHEKLHELYEEYDRYSEELEKHLMETKKKIREMK